MTCIKTGSLAKTARILPSKIRYYVRIGLLHPVGYSPGGYCLFHRITALSRLRDIQQLKKQERLTLAEIKERLMGEESNYSPPNS